jgi:enoyl-CoA hydratase/carnithine racemase
MSEALIVSREERVLRLTLNRPDKRNALSAGLCVALLDALEAAEDDPCTGAVLIEARGDVFCAGMDLEEASVQTTELHERLFTIGMRLRKPIVAAVNGPALGGGLGLVANAHIVAASHGCSFGLTEVRVGMWPFVIWRSMVRAIGERRALSLALTGRIFSVNEAVQWGLVHEVTPPFELDDRATAIAMHVAEMSPQAIRLGLEFVGESRGAGLEEAGRIALGYREQAFASDDFREGVAAFREKRKPQWIKT